jgi:phage terminase large subunit-like protein
MTRARPKYTIGPDVSRWIEQLCVHGPGDVLGKPVRLTADEKRFLAWAYEVDENGRRVIRRAVRGLPKGSRKTEFAAWVALAELAGPCRFDRWENIDSKQQARGGPAHDPYIVAAASTYEQADLLFAAARAAITEGPLAEFFDCFDKEIQRKGGPGVLVRVPAVAGANDGLRPTFVVADETHEWTGNKQRVHLVLENGLAKRKDAWSLQITTAGSPKVDSVALSTYRYGQRVASGEIDDPAFLFSWRETATTVDKLVDAEVLAATVAEVNPESWKDLSTLIRRYREVPLHEFCRYHLNLWIEPDEERWLPPGTWDAIADTERVVPDGSSVVLGFDGSYSGDSTALVAATVDENPHLFVLGLWEHPGGGTQWVVDHDEVEATVHDAFRRFDVREISADPPYWGQQLTRWAELFGEDRVLAFNTFVRKRMSAACSSFYQAATNQTMSHDGDASLARHIQNATLRETAQGAYITKQSSGSPLKIDAAIAAVIAYNRAYWWATTKQASHEAGVIIV